MASPPPHPPPDESQSYKPIATGLFQGGPRRASTVWARKGPEQGGDEERAGPQIEVVRMGAGIFGEGPHDFQARRLRGNAGPDEGWAALFLYRRREVLDGRHVDPAPRRVLAFGQAHRLAGDGCATLQGFALPEELLPGHGLGGRNGRCGGRSPRGPDQRLHRPSGHAAVLRPLSFERCLKIVSGRLRRNTEPRSGREAKKKPGRMPLLPRPAWITAA